MRTLSRMALGDITIAQYDAHLSAYSVALAAGDWQGARVNLLQASSIAEGLGGKAYANSTGRELLTADKVKPLLDAILEAQKQANQIASSNGRFITTGLKNSGRGFSSPTGGEAGGVLHD